jgi:hypothetical protein
MTRAGRLQVFSLMVSAVFLVGAEVASDATAASRSMFGYKVTPMVSLWRPQVLAFYNDRGKPNSTSREVRTRSAADARHRAGK